MIACAYCGRGNDDAAVHCRECGTELGLAASGATAVARPFSPGTRRALVWAGTFFLTAVCIGISSVFFDGGRGSAARTGLFLMVGSPVFLVFGIWIACVAWKLNLRRIEAEILGVLLFATLSCLFVGSLFVALIAITGFGPPG